MDNLNGTRQQEMAQGPDGPKKKKSKLVGLQHPLMISDSSVRKKTRLWPSIHPSHPSSSGTLRTNPSPCSHPGTIQGPSRVISTRPNKGNWQWVQRLIDSFNDEIWWHGQEGEAGGCHFSSSFLRRALRSGWLGVLGATLRNTTVSLSCVH